MPVKGSRMHERGMLGTLQVPIMRETSQARKYGQGVEGMTDYYPIQCTRCKRFLGYSDVDFEDSDNHYTAIWCKYCMQMEPKEKKSDENL